ncbi:Syntaxin 6, N-terminal [Rhizoctonia solani]|uniref:Syntaxin 6, N-terminal n=1 Tax=Rhizoctonia solani TaxID=456999 RepID=A0A8H7IJM8_9AGAM|nr:Syntaxin 6, N-terminal [Rhizoctonia solani]
MSIDPWHDVKNEVQNSLEAATNLRASFLRIQSTASVNSEELNWARNELKGTLAALDADLEDLEESVRIVEEAGGRLFGVEETEVMARRKYVVYVRNQIETMRQEVNTSVPPKSPSTAQMRRSPLADTGPREDEQAEWSRLEQQLEVQRQESTLDTISGTLHTLATQANLIGQEVGEHNELLSELEANVDRSGSKLDSAMKRMKHFIRETEDRSLSMLFFSFTCGYDSDANEARAATLKPSLRQVCCVHTTTTTTTLLSAAYSLGLELDGPSAKGPNWGYYSHICGNYNNTDFLGAFTAAGIRTADSSYFCAYKLRKGNNQASELHPSLFCATRRYYDGYSIRIFRVNQLSTIYMCLVAVPTPLGKPLTTGDSSVFIHAALPTPISRMKPLSYRFHVSIRLLKPGTYPSLKDYLIETRTQATRAAKIVLWPEGAHKVWVGVGYEQTFQDQDIYNGVQRVRGHNGLAIFGPGVQPVLRKVDCPASSLPTAAGRTQKTPPRRDLAETIPLSAAICLDVSAPLAASVPVNKTELGRPALILAPARTWPRDREDHVSVCINASHRARGIDLGCGGEGGVSGIGGLAAQGLGLVGGVGQVGTGRSWLQTIGIPFPYDAEDFAPTWYARWGDLSTIILALAFLGVGPAAPAIGLVGRPVSWIYGRYRRERTQENGQRNESTPLLIDA